MSRRLRLTRSDGKVYLNRWGIECKRGGIFLHKIEAPDPGVDLHNHPWWFGSLILWGGYTEERLDSSKAVIWASYAERQEKNWSRVVPRGCLSQRRWLTFKGFRLNECHRITKLNKRTSWSLIIRGPKRQQWGFFEPTGFVTSRSHATERRPLADNLDPL